MTTTLVKSAESETTTENKSPKKDATKATAADLVKVIMGHRDDKVTASKLVNSFRKEVGAVIYSNGVSMEDKVASIEKAAEAAKAELMAAIDRDLGRGVLLARIPRGTTGKGGLHHQDVTTEIFSTMSRKTAVENNTQALQSAGLL